jgi:carboxypeptidase family protein
MCVIFTVAVCLTVPLAAIRAQQPPKILAAPAAQPAQPAGASSFKPSAQIAASLVKSPVRKPVRRQGLADGSMWGTVYDGSGAVVPGVTVTIASDRFAQQMPTGSAGEYEFRALPPGRYSLTAGLPGFMTASLVGIEIKPGQASHQNVALSIGRIAERVTVSVPGQPKPSVPPGMLQRIRVGGYVQAANLISQVRPIYPQTARDAGVEGTVHMQGIIGGWNVDRITCDQQQ